MSGPATRPAGITTDDLLAQGFTRQQLARLERLRELYPIADYVGSQAEMERLRFARWLHRTGRLDEGGAHDATCWTTRDRVAG